MNSCTPLELLKALSKRGCNRVLWECGATLATAALESNCVQEIHAYVAPKIMGGDSAKTVFGNLGFTEMEDVCLLENTFSQNIDSDWVLTASVEDKC